MKVSVVIPVYNVKPYLERCVNSVLRQTYKDLEIILVDDGSTDGSGELCDDIATRDQRICVIHQENQGLSGARNVGIHQANGDYIAFLDSDDEWLLDDGLEKLLQGGKTDLIVFKRVDIWKKNNRCTANDYDLSDIVKLPNMQTIFSHLVSTQQLQISACFQLVSKQVIFDHNLFFPHGMISEDVFWSLRLWQHLTSVRFTNLNFYGYHHREESITTTVNIRNYHSYDQIFAYWKSECDAECINADAIRAYLANMWVSLGYDFAKLAHAEKPAALSILQKNVDLLHYSQSHKTKFTKLLVQIIGVNLTVIILGKYWQMRH